MELLFEQLRFVQSDAKFDLDPGLRVRDGGGGVRRVVRGPEEVVRRQALRSCVCIYFRGFGV